MASQQELARAVQIVRNNSNQLGKPGSRWHKDGMVLNTAIWDAVTHDCCASCINLRIQTKPSFVRHRESVLLNCAVGNSPVDLWRDMAPGEQPSCPDFSNSQEH